MTEYDEGERGVKIFNFNITLYVDAPFEKYFNYRKYIDRKCAQYFLKNIENNSLMLYNKFVRVPRRPITNNRPFLGGYKKTGWESHPQANQNVKSPKSSGSITLIRNLRFLTSHLQKNGVRVQNYSLTEIKQISRNTGWGSHPTNQIVKSPINQQTTDTDLNETHMVPVPIWP